MYIVHAECGKAICLGRKGEGNARQIVFDVSQWRELFGEGVIQLAAKRMGDAEPYICVVEMDGNHVIWTISEADTAKPGNYGKCELFYYFGNGNVRSEIWQTIVLDSMCVPSADTPEPYQGWLDKILAAGSYAEAERIKAEQARDDAENSATEAAQSASITSKAAKVIEGLMNGALNGGTGLLLTDTETGVLFRLQVTGGKLRMTEVSEND